jgi:hypothetical protein
MFSPRNMMKEQDLSDSAYETGSRCTIQLLNKHNTMILISFSFQEYYQQHYSFAQLENQNGAN